MVGLISGVRKNSLAADAGIKAGEKLCSVDGVQVKDIIELSLYYKKKKQKEDKKE